MGVRSQHPLLSHYFLFYSFTVLEKIAQIVEVCVQESVLEP